MRQALRPYQLDAIQAVRDAIRELRETKSRQRILIVAPTGAGKTTIAAELIHGASAKGSPTMFLAHRRELIDQCSRRLDQWGVQHGVIMAGHPLWQPRRLTQVASVDTLRNRLRNGRWEPTAKIIIIDEAHRSTAPSYEEICDAHPDAVVLGLTATPCRLNGKGLGFFYERMIMVAQPGELVHDGFLMEPTIYAPSTPDLASVKTTEGDFNAKQLQVAVDKPQLIGGIVEHLAELVGHGKRVVVFAAGVEHSLHLRDRFRAAGFRAEHVDGETHKEERSRVLKAINDGEAEVVTNCGILTEGWDLPLLDAVVLARPTKSTSLYLQMVGRVLRPAPGKAQALVIDHAGNVDRHGWPTCDREWELSTGESKPKGESLKNCPKCGFILPSSARICRERDEDFVRRCAAIGADPKADPPQLRREGCGMTFVVEAMPPPEETSGQLVQRKPPSPEERLDFLFEHVCKAKRHNMREADDGFPGWAAHRYKERFKTWPGPKEKKTALERYREWTM